MDKSSSNQTECVRVWDSLVRIAHWTVAVAFVTAWLTGDEGSRLHVLAGYTVAGTVALRLLWGFMGSRHARFTGFVRSPRAVFGYLKGLLTGTAPRYLGHNPAGGAMAVALLSSLALTALSGMMVYALEEGAGPMAAVVGGAPVLTTGTAVGSSRRADQSDDGHERDAGGDAEEFWEEVHEIGADLTLALVVVHVAGVLASSFAHRENLPRAMVTGRKRAVD